MQLPKLLQPMVSFGSALSSGMLDGLGGETHIEHSSRPTSTAKKYPVDENPRKRNYTANGEGDVGLISANILCNMSQQEERGAFMKKSEPCPNGNGASRVKIFSDVPKIHHGNILLGKQALQKKIQIGDISAINNLARLLKQSDYGNLKSPDIFYDSSDDAEEEISSVVPAPVATRSEDASKANNNSHYEKSILRKIKACLTGVLPPPSVTILQIDLFEEIHTRKDSILSFLEEVRQSSGSNNLGKDNEPESIQSTAPLTLWRPTHSVEEVKTLPWKDVLHAKQHGLW